MTIKCPICDKCVSDLCPSICCDNCNLWVHRTKCSALSQSQFNTFCQPNSSPWFCPKCIDTSLPFYQGTITNSSDSKPKVSSCSNVNDEFKSLMSELNEVVDDALVIDDDNEPDFINLNSTSCKYLEYQDFNTLSQNTKSKFSIFHLNIASMAKHFDELNTLLSLLNHNFSFIGISETRFLKNQEPIFDFSIPGYSAINTPTESSAGGVLLYVSNSFAFKPRLDLSQLMYQSKNLESVFVEIIVPKKTNIIVGTIYKHPDMSFNSFNSEFLEPLLHKVKHESKQTILLGDFNVDLLKAEVNSDSSLLLDTLGSNLIVPQILLPTRITRESKTLIDNIFSSISEHGVKSGNLCYSISDHLPQFCLFETPNSQKSAKNDVYVRNWSKFDQTEFILDYLDIEWNSVFERCGFDTDCSFDTFYFKMKALLDRHIPTIKLTKRQIKTKTKPWITPGIIKSMSKRDFFYRKFIKAKDPTSKVNFHNSFKSYRNLIVTLCRNSKSNHFTGYFNQYSSNMQKIWVGVRNLIWTKTKSSGPISISIGDSVTSEPEVVANHFNDFFTSIADSIRETIPPTNRNFTDFLHNRNIHSMFLAPSTPEEVIKVINSLSLSKSDGPNSIPARILKLLKHDISIPLSVLINRSFETGIFPCTLKVSKVIPVYKNKGSPLEVGNYRPISLLSNIEKIFEKLIYSRLIGFLNDSNQIYVRQFGFRKSHSTIHTLINIVARIRRRLDKGEFACGVFVDLQKAFDTVDHEILLSKLRHYGIRGRANQLLKSYLSDRQQFVFLSNISSSLKPVIHGVPQGSVLGPLLFLLYINDLHSSIKSSETYHFADDTHLLNFSKSIQSLCGKVNADLRILSSWLNANKISLNAKKTEFIVFRHRSKPLDFIPFLKLSGLRIYPSHSVKYLGVHLDEHLNWKPQISSIANKLKRANGALSKLRHYVPLKSLLNIYHAIFASHIRYGCQIWGLCDNTTTHRILTLQKTALRLITFSEPRSPSSPIFSELGILKFFDQVEVLNILLVHQHLNRKLPLDSLETLNFNQIHHSAGTRGNSLGLLNLPNVNTTMFGLNSLTRLSARQWNNLQRTLPTLRLADLTYSKLKSLAHSHYIQKYLS